MQKYISDYIKEGEQFSKLVNEKFGALTPEQFNWKPDTNRWSVGQCIEHIILTNKKYFDIFSKIANDSYKPGTWQKIGLLKGFWGKFLIKAVHPDNAKKVKTMSSITPHSSNIDKSILIEFDDNIKTTLDFFAKCDGKDIEHITISSPLASSVVYALKDVFPILIYHTQRHINQAEKVTKTEGFPK